MHKLNKSNKIFNFTVKSKFYYFEPIKKKNINKKYLNWINNSDINKFLNKVSKKRTIKDLYENINTIRKEGGELYSVHKKKNSSHIGNLTISFFNNLNSNADYNVKKKLISFGLMIGDQKSREVGAGGYITLMLVSLLFDLLKYKKIFAGSTVKNYKAINSLKTIGFSTQRIKNGAEYFELNKYKWKKIKKNFSVDNLKIKISYK